MLLKVRRWIDRASIVSRVPGFRFNVADGGVLFGGGVMAFVAAGVAGQQAGWLVAYAFVSIFMFCNVLRPGGIVEPVWGLVFLGMVYSNFRLADSQLLGTIVVSEVVRFVLVVLSLRCGWYEGVASEYLLRCFGQVPGEGARRRSEFAIGFSRLVGSHLGSTAGKLTLRFFKSTHGSAWIERG